MSPENQSRTQASAIAASSDAATEPIGNFRIREGTTQDVSDAPLYSAATGSTTIPTTNGWTLLSNFLTGNLSLDWRNLWKLVQPIIFIATIAFIGFLFYQDNQTGLLQDADGLKKFGIKAVSIFIPMLLVILGVSVVFWIDRRFGSTKKSK